MTLHRFHFLSCPSSSTTQPSGLPELRAQRSNYWTKSSLEADASYRKSRQLPGGRLISHDAWTAKSGLFFSILSFRLARCHNDPKFARCVPIIFLPESFAPKSV